MPELVIERGGAELLDELRPLWLALRDRHGAVMPELGPVRDDDESWWIRRSQYVGWLELEGSFVLLARDGDGAVGYAFVRPTAEGESPTWRLPLRGMVLETLSVAPRARGRGVGAALVARVRAETADCPALTLGAMAGNADALRFYAREGFEVVGVELRDTRRGS